MKIIGDGGHARVVREAARHVWAGDPTFMFIAVGNNADRKNEARKHTGPFAIVIDMNALVAHGVEIGDGTVIMAGAVVQTGARIGKHCIINTGATVDHDCVIGDYAHIAPGAHLCGDVHIGEGTLVGVGVGIAPGCKVPAWVLVRARRLEMEPLYAV